VHVVKVDGVGAEPSESALHRLLHLGGLAPDVRVTLRRVAHPAELSGQLGFVPPLPEQLGDQLLVAAAAVDVRRVDEADAGIHGVSSVLRAWSTSPYTGVRAMPPNPKGLTLRPSPSRTDAAAAGFMELSVFLGGLPADSPHFCPRCGRHNGESCGRAVVPLQTWGDSAPGGCRGASEVPDGSSFSPAAQPTIPAMNSSLSGLAGSTPVAIAQPTVSAAPIPTQTA
jgi:hypothetical protein